MDGYVDRQTLQDIADAIREKNGSEETYTPSEMAEAIRGIEGGGEGLDFSIIGYNDEQNIFFNNILKKDIEYSKEVFQSRNGVVSGNLNYTFAKYKSSVFPQMDFTKVTNTSNAISNSRYLIFAPDFNFANATSLMALFSSCYSLRRVGKIYAPKNTNMFMTFYNCYALEEIEYIESTLVNNFADCWMNCTFLKKLSIDTSNATNMNRSFNSCSNLEIIRLTSVKNVTNFSAFSGVSKLQEIYFEEWKQASVSLANASLLSPESIHYIIQNAMSLTDGATARTLTLHATAKTNWQNSEYYEQDLAVLTDKGITIA